MSSYTENVNTDIDIAISNPSFVDGADWVPDVKWSIAGGKAIFDTLVLGNWSITQALPDLVEDNFYDVTFTMSEENFIAPQGLVIILAGKTGPTVFRDNGRFTERIQAGDAVKQIEFRNPVSSFPQGCKITNILIVAIGTEFFEDLEIDHRTVRGALRYSVPDGDKIYHALSYKDKTNCYIKYTP